MKTEHGIKLVEIAGKDNLQEIRLNICANQFDFSFESTSPQFMLKPPQFNFNLQKD